MKLSQTKSMLKRLACALLVLLMAVSAVDLAALETASAGAAIYVAPTITATGLTYPTNITQGNAFSLRGTLSVNAGVITQITATVTNRVTKKVAMNVSVHPKTKEVNIRNTINKKVVFGKLPVGDYTLKMVVTAKCGTKEATKTVINHGFTVNGNKPKLSIAGAVYPTTIKAGNKAPLRGVINTSCGKITQVTAYILDSNGSTKMKASYKPNKSFFSLEYTVNKVFTFGLLAKGTYTYKIVAKAANGKYSTTATVLEKNFTVE